VTWELLLAFGLGLLLGSVVAGLARGETVKFLREQLAQARKAEELATDRLVHAWKDGAQIPPRPSEPAPPPVVLPKDLQDYVAQWEDPEHRAEQEAQVRELLGTGRSPMAVLQYLEDQHP
jgi:hypothetical protein